MKRFKVIVILLVVALLSACGGNSGNIVTEATTATTTTEFITTADTVAIHETIAGTDAVTVAEAVTSENDIPDYSGSAYIVLNNNKPEFTTSEITTEAFEKYSELDYSGRCGVAFACLGLETMPTQERGEIGMIKPTGWQLKKYDCVDGKYLYNRCHLIGFQLSGENANDKNLITGTRYLNIDGMLPFENRVADYIEETSNHVMYRVTPIFEGDNLLCKGVKMEAYSVEDNGKGVSFNVFCYNVQPSIKINYENGESYLLVTTTTQPSAEATTAEDNQTETNYILNTSSKKFHSPDCSSVNKMSDKNKETYSGSRNDLITRGYSPCGNCKP